MKGFKLSPIHLPPLHRIKIRRTHYRMTLIFASGCIFMANRYAPAYEAHVAFATNFLFAIDPTS